MDDKIQSILDQARASISDFCINECHAYCCRKGYLVLTPEQVAVTMQGRDQEYIDNGSLKLMSDGNFSLYMNKHPCPSLKDNMCMIHNNRLRSDTCRIFPIHVENNTIRISTRCLAGKQDLFYPFVSQLIALGCKQEE
ncbi:YkgJ family cysteine cluster protein [Nanoarchaeota archaeon]